LRFSAGLLAFDIRTSKIGGGGTPNRTPAEESAPENAGDLLCEKQSLEKRVHFSSGGQWHEVNSNCVAASAAIAAATFVEAPPHSALSPVVEKLFPNCTRDTLIVSIPRRDIL
jgi:hypothetical protein